MKKAILFDMNGVIVDDEKLHEMAFRAVLHAKFHHELTHDDYLAFFAGRTDKDGFQEYFSHKSVSGNIDQLIEEKSHYYHNLAAKGLKKYSGISEFIERLSMENYALAVVTSSTKREAQAVLETFNLDHYFNLVITAEDISTGKPSPEGYLKAANALNNTPSQCVVIEDAPSGIKAAKAASMMCIAVTNTHPANALNQADMIIDEFDAEAVSQILS